MTDKHLYDLYVEHICEKVILAGIRTIVGDAYERAAEVCDEHVAECEKQMNDPQQPHSSLINMRAAYDYAASAIRALKGEG